MMTHGHKITSGYMAGVVHVDVSETQYKRAQPSRGLADAERRTVRDGSKEVQGRSKLRTKANKLQMANTRQRFPWEEGTLYNEARVNIRKAACVAVSSRVRRTNAWHDAYFNYGMRRYAVAKRKEESAQRHACGHIEWIKLDDGICRSHVLCTNVWGLCCTVAGDTRM